MKTPEEMAEEYADESPWHLIRDGWTIARDSFLAGYKAAMKSTEWQMRVLNNLDELIKEPNENT